MKKISLFVALCLVLFALVACSNHDESKKHTHKSEKQSKQLTSKNDLRTKNFKISVDEAIHTFKQKHTNVKLTSVKLDHDHGQFVYSIAGADSKNEYKMDFDVNTKKIVKNKSDSLDSDDKAKINTKIIDLNGIIKPKEAMKKANNAQQGPIKSYEITRSGKNTAYEISILTGSHGEDIDVYVNAKDGSIISKGND